ncbi:MAG: hypothetical protein C5B58_03300 [Acidobacteria bacterium]|nr:MAG: hypothetical protein C5B58_03300 [Acidobacteriota bacterium]
MPKRAIDFETVRKLARQVGEVEDATVRGWPCLKAQGKLFAWMPIKKSVEPGTLAVRIDLEDRAELIANAPEIYYVTDHYLNYPSVLVRLARIQEDALNDLLGMAWRFTMMKAAKPSRRVKTARGPASGPRTRK